MRDRLPETIDPASLTQAGREYQGRLPVQGMTRLAELLHDKQSPDLDVTLLLARDADGVRFIQGQVTGRLHLCCQRCLGRLEWPIALQFKLALVQSDSEFTRLEGLRSGEYDPLLIEADRVSLARLIEDELLLAVADFPQHGSAENCELPPYDEAQAHLETEDKPNPFAVLEDLKRK